MFDYFDDFGIEGWMIFGSANEELADDEKEITEIEKDYFDDELDEIE